MTIAFLTIRSFQSLETQRFDFSVALKVIRELETFVIADGRAVSVKVNSNINPHDGSIRGFLRIFGNRVREEDWQTASSFEYIGRIVVQDTPQSRGIIARAERYIYTERENARALAEWMHRTQNPPSGQQVYYPFAGLLRIGQ